MIVFAYLYVSKVNFLSLLQIEVLTAYLQLLLFTFTFPWPHFNS